MTDCVRHGHEPRARTQNSEPQNRNPRLWRVSMCLFRSVFLFPFFADASRSLPRVLLTVTRRERFTVCVKMDGPSSFIALFVLFLCDCSRRVEDVCWPSIRLYLGHTAHVRPGFRREAAESRGCVGGSVILIGCCNGAASFTIPPPHLCNTKIVLN